MFTGIIETTGRVEVVTEAGTGKTFWLSSPFTGELKIDQSVSHDGACLTVEEISGDRFRVTAIRETLEKTNLSSWQTGSIVNLERSMLMNGHLDGHIVQGHVDTTAECIEVKEMNGSWEYRFRFPEKFAPLVIEKGSITVNGISLTIFKISRDEFSVAVIPYTYDHTNVKDLRKGNNVNIEFDIIGKYISRYQSLQQ